jgi:hypothetical protein
MNPPRSSDKLHLVGTFSDAARRKAQNIVTMNIASSVAALAKRLLSRQWIENISEKVLWEGNRILGEACLIAGEPPLPSQPSRIPVLVLKEITSQLNRIGIELLNKEFVHLTAKLCLERIATLYKEIPLEISADAAIQIYADMTFFTIALPGIDRDLFKESQEKLREKVPSPDHTCLTFSVLKGLSRGFKNH